MLKLAKPESKKEMALKKKKKTNDMKKSNKNRNLKQNIIKIPEKLEKQNIKQNPNTSKNRISHIIIKKKDLENRMNKSIKKNKNNIIPKPNPILIINNNKIKNIKSKSPRNLSSIRREKNKITKNYLDDINLKKSNSFRIKKNSLKNDKNYSLSKSITGNKERNETNPENILKTVENGRIRKLFAMSSDIFNLDDTATNLIKRVPFTPKYSNFYRTIYKKEENNIFKDELNQIGLNLNNKDKYKDNLSKNILELSKDNKKKKFNKIDFFKRFEYNQKEINPFGEKGCLNMESVKYDIISTRKSNIYDKYNNLSGIKATSPNIEDYEILLPKNYSKANMHSFKNVFNSNGLQFFGLKEEGDIIGGQKGKFKIKIRMNGQNEKENNRSLNKINKKLLGMDAKLKKNLIDLGKKRTDITGYGWEKEIKNLF